RFRARGDPRVDRRPGLVRACPCGSLGGAPSRGRCRPLARAAALGRALVGADGREGRVARHRAGRRLVAARDVDGAGCGRAQRRSRGAPGHRVRRLPRGGASGQPAPRADLRRRRREHAHSRRGTNRAAAASAAGAGDTSRMTAQILLGVVVVLCLSYLVVVTLVALGFVIVGAVENAFRKLEHQSTDYATLASSRFTVPVSVIVAAYNEERVIASTVRSLLEFDYPEFEVVVVNDGSSDGTLE